MSAFVIARKEKKIIKLNFQKEKSLFRHILVSYISLSNILPKTKEHMNKNKNRTQPKYQQIPKQQKQRKRNIKPDMLTTLQSYHAAEKEKRTHTTQTRNNQIDNIIKSR